jgi:hypothetical protein
MTKRVVTKVKPKPTREWVRLDLRLVHNRKLLLTTTRLVRRPASTRKINGIVNRWIRRGAWSIAQNYEEAWHVNDSDMGGTVALGPVVQYTMTSVYL